MKIGAAIALAALATLLVTCGGDVAAVAEQRTAAGSEDGGAGTGQAADTGKSYSIPCALNGADGFGSTCTVEQHTIEGTQLLAVFHPDGGFRRFEVLPDRAGLAAVAGADKLTQTLSGDSLEISIAANRYRFPASTD